jgi:hypothetical protein
VTQTSVYSEARALRKAGNMKFIHARYTLAVYTIHRKFNSSQVGGLPSYTLSHQGIVIVDPQNLNKHKRWKHADLQVIDDVQNKQIVSQFALNQLNEGRV